MAFTKIVGAGIHTLSNVHTHNINSSGIITATNFVGIFSGTNGDFSGDVTIDGNLTVNGTTTTLDTNLTEVDKVEVAANNSTVGVAITQSGTGDIINLFDGSTEVLTVKDGGEVGINTTVVPYGNFAVDHGQYGLTRISEYSHILVQNKNASTTQFWNFAPRDDGSVTIGRGVPGSAGIFTDKKITITSGGDLIHSALNKTLSLVTTQNQTNAGTKIAFFGANRYDTDEEFAAIKGFLISNSGGSGKQNGGLQFVIGSASHTHAMTQAGYVGIGTGNPTSLFHMSGSAPRITLTDTAGTDDIAKIFSTGGSLYFQQRDGSSHGNIIFRTEDNSGAEERLRINSSGKISQGGHTPSYEYDLRGTGLQSILIGSENAGGAMLILDGDSNGDGAGTDYGSILHSADGNIEINNRKSGSIIFKNTSSETERLRINSTGTTIFKGAGGSVDQIKIESHGGGAGIFISNFQGVDAGDASSRLGVGKNDNALIFMNASGSQVQNFAIGTTDAVPLVFSTSNAKRLVIDSDGAVNIGSNPAQATGAYTQYAVLTAKGYPANETSASILALVRGNNTTSTAAGHTLGRIVFSDKQAGEYAMIEGQAEHNGAVGDTPGRIIFATTTDGATSPTEKIRIDWGGNLDLTGGGNIIINDNKKLYFEGDRDDDFNCIGRQNSENSIVLTSRFNLANIIDSNNDDTDSFWSVRHNGTTVAGSDQLLRVRSDGHIVTQGLTSWSFNNDGNNAKVFEVTGDGTVGEYGVINISGNQNATTSLVGAVKFINRENAHTSSGSGTQSRSIATIDVLTVTTDNNAGDDCGGMLRIVNKAEGAGNAETIRFNSDGTIRAGGGAFAEPTIRLVLNNPNSASSQMQFQDTGTGNGHTDGFRVGYNGVGGQLWNFENNYVRIATNNKERFTIAGNGTLYHRSDSTQSIGTNPLVTLENPEGNSNTGTVLKLKTGRGQGVIDMPIFHIIDGNNASLFEVENSGRVGIFNAAPAFLLDIVNNTSDEGIRLRSTGNTYHSFYFDAARTGANQHIGRFIARWNGTNTSMIAMNTDSDTTNKDNGHIAFCASEAGGSLIERFRCNGSDAGLIMQNDCFIKIPHDERCIVFDEGQKMITSNDGQGNFNIMGGKDHNNQHVSSASGTSGVAQICLSSDGSDGRIDLAVGPRRNAGDPANVIHGLAVSYVASGLNGLLYTKTTSGAGSPTSLGGNFPVIHKGNASDGTWANVAGDGFKVLGDGGSIAITTNDGYGNCNVCWNHKDGVPDTAGSSWRIRCDIDAANSDMNFQTAASVSSGSAQNVGSRMVLASNGNLQIDGSYSSSDRRLKTNIQTITGATDKIKALTGKTFKWKDGLEMPSGTKYGFIAQEVESVVPDLVDESRIRGFDKDGNITQDHYHNKDDIVEWSKGVDDSGITPILVEALKEALSEIDSLKARVSTLEGS